MYNGDILSPILFNLYSEYIFREALNEVEEGIFINGTRLNNLRYADDTIVFADTVEGLMDRITETSSRYGLDIIRNKIKRKKNTTRAHISIYQIRKKECINTNTLVPSLLNNGTMRKKFNVILGKPEVYLIQ